MGDDAAMVATARTNQLSHGRASLYKCVQQMATVEAKMAESLNCMSARGEVVRKTSTEGSGGSKVQKGTPGWLSRNLSGLYLYISRYASRRCLEASHKDLAERSAPENSIP